MVGIIFVIYSAKQDDMEFNISSTSVTEGDIIEVTWNCPGAEFAEITINNGYKSQSSTVANQGAKKYKLIRSKGRTAITLNAIENGKKESQKLSVRVKKIKPIKARINYRERRTTPFKAKFQQFLDKIKFYWSNLTEKKRIVLQVIGMLLVLSVLCSFFPQLWIFGIMAVIIILLIKIV